MIDRKLGTVVIRESDGNILKLEIHDELQSTAELAKKYAQQGYPDRFVVFTQRQQKSVLTGGKLGDTSYEEGVFMSLLLRPSIFPSQASLLGSMTAAATVKALEEHTEKQLGIGWVSTVYCDGNKIGSTIIEGKLDNFTAYEYLIITFAIKLDKENFPPRLTDMINKVFNSENTSIAMIIARNILSKFFAFYPNLKSSNKFMDIYKDKFALRGCRIKYGCGPKKRRTKVLGIDKEDGTLLVESKGGSVEKVCSPIYVILPKRVKLKNSKAHKKSLPE